MTGRCMTYQGRDIQNGSIISGCSMVMSNGGRVFIRPSYDGVDIPPFMEVRPDSLHSIEMPCTPPLEKIRVQLAKAKSVAEQLGVTLEVSEDTFIDDNHLDCVWYGGYLGSLSYKGYLLIIEVHGDVVIVGYESDPVLAEFEYSDKNDHGAYCSDDTSLRDAFSSDYELFNAVQKQHIHYSNNNWVEYFIKSPDGVWHDGDVIDDCVLDAFSDIAEWVKLLDRFISKAES